MVAKTPCLMLKFVKNRKEKKKLLRKKQKPKKKKKNGCKQTPCLLLKFVTKICCCFENNVFFSLV